MVPTFFFDLDPLAKKTKQKKKKKETSEKATVAPVTIMECDQISMDKFGKPYDDRTVPEQEEVVSFRGTLKRTDEDCVEEQAPSPYLFCLFSHENSRNNQI